MDEYYKCANCVYFCIDEESGDGYCKQTYTWTTSESYCDSFVDANDYQLLERSDYESR